MSELVAAPSFLVATTKTSYEFSATFSGVFDYCYFFGCRLGKDNLVLAHMIPVFSEEVRTEVGYVIPYSRTTVECSYRRICALRATIALIEKAFRTDLTRFTPYASA